MELDPFYESCWKQVVQALPQYLDVTPTGAVFLVSDYEDYQGVDSLVAMAGFLQYAKDNAIDKSTITITLAHDLGGRKDKLMLPRTSDYSQYAKQLHD